MKTAQRKTRRTRHTPDDHKPQARKGGSSQNIEKQGYRDDNLQDC